MKIPRLMHQIWVGPKPPPELWLQTWREQHPHWTYRLWGNEDLEAGGWINARHMAFYFQRWLFNGVADLMRYEILLRHGGIVVAADSICLNPVDELFEDNFELYTINTGEYGNVRIERNLGSTTPLYAAVPNHPFTKRLVEGLHARKRLGRPVHSTGNRYMQRMLRQLRPKIRIWPMHYFISDHFNGWRYDGPDKVYARHFWGTTRGTYALGTQGG